MKKINKKLLILGNMNGNGIILQAWLNDYFNNITIFSFDSSSHWDNFRFERYNPKFVSGKDISCLGYRSFLTFRFKKFLKGFDVIIGMGIAPLLCNIHGVKLDIFIPYGGDIRWLTDYRRIWSSNSVKSFIIQLCETFLQIKGIKKCENIFLRKMHPPVYPSWIYKKFKTNHYNTLNLTPLHLDNPPDIIRCDPSEEIIMINPCRHKWSESRNPSDKGQDVLLYGISNYITKYKKHNFKIIFFEYGDDCEKSKNLIKKLGIESYVEWHPQCSQEKVYDLIKKSHLVLLEGANSCEWNSCHAQTIIAHKPFIAYLEESDEIYSLSLNLKFDSFEHLLNKFFEDPLSLNEEVSERFKFLKSEYIKSVNKILEAVENKRNDQFS